MCKPKIDNTAQERQQRDAERARQQELQRQNRVDAGLRDISALFEGGRYRTGFTEETTRTPRPQITRVDGPMQEGGFGEDTTFAPSTLFAVGDKTFDTRAAAKDYRRGLPNEQTIRKPVFDRSTGVEPFLDQRRQAQNDFFFPQLDRQYEDAGDDLINALARAGILRSTVATEKQTDLENQFSEARAKVASDIDADIAATRSALERERQALESGLRASADRGSAVGGAQRAIFNIREDAPDFSPIPALFEGVTAGIGAGVQGYQNGQIRRRLSEAGLDTGSGGTIIS